MFSNYSQAQDADLSNRLIEPVTDAQPHCWLLHIKSANVYSGGLHYITPYSGARINKEGELKRRVEIFNTSGENLGLWASKVA